jgi:hypothetical protein
MHHQPEARSKRINVTAVIGVIEGRPGQMVRGAEMFNHHADRTSTPRLIAMIPAVLANLGKPEMDEELVCSGIKNVSVEAEVISCWRCLAGTPSLLGLVLHSSK